MINHQLVFADMPGIIYGGSCIQPLVEADIYIDLDKNAVKNPQHIRYIIEDFSVPADIDSFRELIHKTIELLKDGNSVHVGCMAGNGRTGLFLSALAQEVLQFKDISAIDYVREHYSLKAVETIEQVLFLKAYFNISTPQREKDTILYIQQEFKNITGIELYEVISQEFDACRSIIRQLEYKYQDFSKINAIDRKTHRSGL